MSSQIPTHQLQATPDPTVIDAINGFGFRLLAQIAPTQSNSNLFLSPLSIASALSMTWNGAAAETLTAMAAALGFGELDRATVNRVFSVLLTTDPQPDPQVVIAQANSLWLSENDPPMPTFVEILQRHFAAEIAAVNFDDPKTAARINSWVAEKTRGKIERLVEPAMLNGALLALINAIYFKGEWQAQFNPRFTIDRPFTRGDGTTKSHPLMAQTKRFAYLEDAYLQAVALPYGDGRYQMVVILPRPSVSFSGFQQRFTLADWQHIIRSLRIHEVELALPRFRIESGFELSAPLAALGMKIAFTPNADFAGIASGPLFISTVIHKALLEVNEKGAEAAAATAVIMKHGRSVERSEMYHMTVDHPFLCAIYDTMTQATLFSGHVVDPLV